MQFVWLNNNWRLSYSHRNASSFNHMFHGDRTEAKMIPKDCTCVWIMSVCAGVYERRKRVWSEAFSTSRLQVDGHVGTVNWAQQREEGVVFFSHRRWLVALESGRVVCPGAQFLCYLSHCVFFLHNTPCWGPSKHAMVSQSLMPRPSVWTLLPLRNASTTRVIYPAGWTSMLSSCFVSF